VSGSWHEAHAEYARERVDRVHAQPALARHEAAESSAIKVRTPGDLVLRASCAANSLAELVGDGPVLHGSHAAMVLSFCQR
jgi:hypothetical protein